MLSAIGAAIAQALAGNLLDKMFGVFDSYFKKEISREQAQAALSTAIVQAFAEIEKSHADALAKTYASFMTAMSQSPLMQRAWACVVYTQLGVLLWHQLGIPAFVKITGSGYPSSGTTVDWAYLLLGLCLGAGPLVLRSGAGASSYDALRKMVGR